MSSADESTEPDDWDPQLTQRMVSVLRPIVKTWYRSEVRGLELLPRGGALLVSNHSGGVFPMDTPVLAVDFYDRFGYERPLLTLSHDSLFSGPTAGLFARIGYIRATQDNCARALRSGNVVIVYPGGDYDSARPVFSANTVDFNGRMGYVEMAVKARVPIVPTVSIGGQEAQLFLSRGQWLARRLGLDRFRIKYVPISFGFPFGPSFVVPVNLPLPTKIVTRVLNPIDVVAEFGEDADPAVIDAHVRSVMQEALDELAAQRRFPVVG